MTFRTRLTLLASCAVLLITTIGLPAAELKAAGATFPAPLYNKWIESFQARNPAVHIRYEATGSEAGIQMLRDGKLDFAASDLPPADGQEFWHLPTVAGAVVPAYNLPGFTGDLRLSPQALAGIFLGKITKWNDPQIRQSNRGVKLPASSIVVVHRSDGSGTTFVLSDYLSKVSAEWRAIMGRGSTLKWWGGEAAEGNEGVASKVAHTANSIGYVEFIYSVEQRLASAAVQNAAGHFVQADIPSVTAAAASATNMPDDFGVSITNAPGDQAYPIASFTWFLVPAHSTDSHKRQELCDFLSWALSSGEKTAAALGYVALPPDLIARELAMIQGTSFSRR